MARRAGTVAAALFVAGLLAGSGSGRPAAGIGSQTTITIDSSPPQVSTSSTAVFEFAADPPEDLRCYVDRVENPVGVCTSPQTYALPNGTHLFRVEQFDRDPDTPGQERRWTIKSLPPDTEITDGPAETVDDLVATFEFESDQAGATFECRLGDDQFAPCESGM